MPTPSVKLPAAFYERDSVTVARDLLGKHLCRVIEGEVQIGKIVEVEAYLGPRDLAAHASKGLTKRTQVLFGPPGHAYVYLIYGIYCCMNVVTGRVGMGTAVLLRALEPVANLHQRTQGPGLLCKALAIDRALNGHDLQSDDLFLAEPPAAEGFTIVEAPRIGVDYAGEWAGKLLRFYIGGNRFVSKK